MKIDKLTFDGSPEEFAAVSHLFGPQEAVTIPGIDVSDEGVDDRTIEMMERVVTRTSLAPSHRAMLREIVGAGDKGIVMSDLVEAIGSDDMKFRGVMGSFGRRAAGTPGWGNKHFLDFEWDQDANQWRYWINEPFRSAVAAKL